MRVAALYDIHGNLPALRAVFDELRREGVRDVVIGGDVAAGALPRETLGFLMELGAGVHFVRGNADREIVDAFDTGAAGGPEAGPTERIAAFCAGRISKAERDFLADSAERVVLDVDGLGEALFCHASPRSDSENLTTATSEERLRRILDGVGTRVVVCGHTHRQFDRLLDEHRVVNAGSVGLPYEGRAGAYWALLGPEVDLRRTAYDIEAAVAQMRASDFPELDGFLQESLLDPMDPDAIAAIFEHQALASE